MVYLRSRKMQKILAAPRERWGAFTTRRAVQTPRVLF
jgi:hypothetical protein